MIIELNVFAASPFYQIAICLSVDSSADLALTQRPTALRTSSTMRIGIAHERTEIQFASESGTIPNASPSPGTPSLELYSTVRCSIQGTLTPRMSQGFSCGPTRSNELSTDTADMAYYKLEIGSGSSPGEWTTFGTTHRGRVVDGTLEALQAEALPAGVYTIRLVIVREDGNYGAVYPVAITIE